MGVPLLANASLCGCREGNATAAALYLGCFAHGLEDRSSPYHAFGGADAVKAAVEAKYNLTATCKANAPPASTGRCEILFWGANDGNLNLSAAGYTPLVLGTSLDAIGEVVGGRMEAMAAESRELMLMPGGYVDAHLADPGWWNGTAGQATREIEGRMGTQSTRLVADAWATAWALAHSNATNVSTPPTKPRSRGNGQTSAAVNTPEEIEAWVRRVRAAAAHDRLEITLGR